MRNIVLLGSPGSGKGSVADLLISKYSYLQISTGELCRNEIVSNSKLGQEIEKIISTGHLLSDEKIIELLESAYKIKGERGCIFDGFPRRSSQAEYLDNFLHSMNEKLNFVILLLLPEEIAIKRIQGRYNCSSCNKIYNQYYSNPAVNGVCDECGNNLEISTRSDDKKIEIVKARFKRYKEQIDPIIDYYEQKKILYKVDANRNINDIMHDIKILHDKCVRI